VLLTAVVLVALLVGYRGVARSLPQIDGTITVTGLHADTTIARDASGIPTMTGANRADVAYATGFAHGQDRFFEMDLSRRNAAGELAELFGTMAVKLDKRNRLHRFRARAKKVLVGMAPQEEAILDAYTRGVNAGLESLASKPIEYYLLGGQPVAWRMEDSMLVAYSMFMVLNDERAGADVERGIAHSVLPLQVYAFMYPEGTQWDAPVSGTARPLPPLPDAGIYDLSAMRVTAGRNLSGRYPAPVLPGSNNWAVSGDLTASGRAMVANDMHLQIKVPNVFYRARLVVRGQSDTTGLTLPGVPVVVAGSNGKLAWGFTNSYGDWSDAILVKQGPNEDSYQTAEGPRRFEVYEETITVKGATAETMTVRDTVWGPLLDDGAYPGKRIAVSWIAHSPIAVNLHQLALEQAVTVRQALNIANTLGIPPQNFVCGDADGNIGWTIAGKIPRRGTFDTRLPQDWSETNGPSGWLPPSDYPRVVNPPSGRLWTANARVVDGEALKAIGFGGYDLGARARQIRDDLFARESFEPADMLQIQADDRALFLSRWQTLLLDTLDETALRDKPERREYRDLVAGWDARASVDSVGYRLVRKFRLELRASVFDMLMAPVREAYGPDIKLRISNQFEAPLWNLLEQQPRHLLAANYASWKDLMLAAVDRNIMYFTDSFDGKLSARRWGERNTAAIRHPLSRAVPILSRWLDMPADELSGDSNMPKVLGPAIGASERFAVSPGDEEHAYLHMPAGQSGHPMSDFYRAGHDDWVQLRATPFLPGNALHLLTLTDAR